MKFYAGVGPRLTPNGIRLLMAEIASVKRAEGWWLRSGHGTGAEQSFERGAYYYAHVFLPWRAYAERGAPVYGAVVHDEPTPEAMEMAARYQPNWAGLPDERIRLLLACNCHVILGPDLDDPVREVVCWTATGSLTGEGLNDSTTGHALRVARAHGVETIVNLQRADHRLIATRAIWPDELSAP